MLLGHSARLRSGVRSPMGNDGILRVMAEADDMQSLEALLRRVDALDGTRDAYAVALEVRDILDAGLDLLYRGDHRGELPRNPKLPERMGARTGRAFLAEANLTEAAEFIRVVGCNALNGRKVKVTQAAQAVKNVRLVVQALQAKQDPSAPPYVPCRPLTEAQTRREYIDVYLQEAAGRFSGRRTWRCRARPASRSGSRGCRRTDRTATATTFWERATLEEAEELRLALRALAVFVKTDRRAQVVLQLDDETETLPNVRQGGHRVPRGERRGHFGRPHVRGSVRQREHFRALRRPHG